MTAPQPDLKLLRVDLMQESYKTYRLQNGGHADQFPVILWFTRSLDAYERAALKKHFAVQLSDDAMQAVIQTTHDGMSREIEKISNDLASVVSDAKAARTADEETWAAAKAEDERIALTVNAINNTLKST